MNRIIKIANIAILLVATASIAWACYTVGETNIREGAPALETWRVCGLMGVLMMGSFVGIWYMLSRQADKEERTTRK